MALSLEAIYQPLNDFFVENFGAAAGVRVQFKFDKLGSVITDTDFVDENHPGAGYVEALAIEKFSDLVNRVPVDAGDGLSVLLSQDSIDDGYYYRLLSPAVPYLPGPSEPATTQALLDTFSLEKAKALELWGKVSMESMSGFPLQYKPSQAMPRAWYDSMSDDCWTTNRQFEIPTPAGQLAPPGEAELWKLALPTHVVGHAIDPVPTQPDGPEQAGPSTITVDLQSRLHRIRVAARADAFDAAVPAGAALVGESHAPIPLMAHPLCGISVDHAMTERASVAIASNTVPAQNLNVPQLRAATAAQISELDIRDRLLLRTVIAPEQPTAATTTERIVVKFDYCVVNVKRLWLFDVFLNADNWSIPGVGQGALSNPTTPGAIPRMPIAMVAIRNLSITANWSADDLAASTSAMAFGPFRVDGGIANGSLTHEAVQTIGWVLQDMPELPPRAYQPDPGSTASSSVQTTPDGAP